VPIHLPAPRSSIVFVVALLLAAGCQSEPVLPAVSARATAFAQAIGNDSLRITIENSHEREVSVFLCATKLQALGSAGWTDIPEAGPLGCIYGVSEPIIAPGAESTFTIAYAFGPSTAMRRAVLSVGLGGLGRESRRLEPTDSLPTAPLGEGR
jgi:hypothetical protein